MTTLGTKHISAAFTRSYKWFPSAALTLSSRAVYFSRPSSLTILFLWDSSKVGSTSWGILIGYAGWARKCAAYWGSGEVLLAPKFGGLEKAASIDGIWAVNAGWEDVPSPNLDLRACSSRLVSLATSNCPTLFYVGRPIDLFLRFPFFFRNCVLWVRFNGGPTFHLECGIIIVHICMKIVITQFLTILFYYYYYYYYFIYWKMIIKK